MKSIELSKKIKIESLKMVNTHKKKKRSSINFRWGNHFSFVFDHKNLLVKIDRTTLSLKNINKPSQKRKKMSVDFEVGKHHFFLFDHEKTAC